MTTHTAAGRYDWDVSVLPPPPTAPPAPPPCAEYADQQVAEANTKIRAAYEKVHSAIGVSMARDLGNDPTSQLAAATSAGQALLAGSEYLITTLSEETMTAPGLATAIRKLASLFHPYTVDYLNRRTNAEAAAALRAGDDIALRIGSSHR